MAGKNLRISVISYFFVAFVLDGLQRLSGLFVLELLQSRNVSRQHAAIPFIFSWVASNIIAAFSAILIDNRKSECIMLFGILLCATGAALCILANDITTLILFWGLMFGSGYGLVSPHLSKRLKSSNTPKSWFILQLTPSLGTTFMPFVFSMLNSYYGLQGSYLIFCGIILNYLPLTLAAAYNFEIYIPNIKWRVRKKSKQYFVSKHEEGKTVSVESFINSLEPDLILQVNQNGESQNDTTIDSAEFSTNVAVIPTGRKRTETRGNDLQGLDMDIQVFSRTPSQMVVEIENYERRRKLFEGSFNQKDIINEEMGEVGPKTDSRINCDIINSIKTLEKLIMNTKANSDLNLKNQIPDKISECEKNETAIENKELEKKDFRNDAVNNTALADISVVLSNTTLQSLEGKKEYKAHQASEKCEKEKEIAPKTENKKHFNQLSSNKSEIIKQVEKENLQLSPHSLQNKSTFKQSLDIKVYVEEYTFATEEEYWSKNSSSQYLKDRKSSYKNHLNSRGTLHHLHTNIDFTSQQFPKSFAKCSALSKPKLSSVYSISEHSELGDKRNFSERTTYKEKNNNNQSQVKQILKFLSKMTTRACLSILLITIIFKINLVTLLTMFADFGNDVDNINSDFKLILVAFGAGGFIGKMCCCKISRTIPEKYHSIGVVLFLLNGLSTAGVLYSPNLNWLAGFYCILGALESGITYIIPKFILEYIDRDIHPALSSVKSFLSGVAIICIPYAIGLFRDEMGDYEFLLQILSCSSILCAFLTYFLPHLRTLSNKRITPSLRSKLQNASSTRLFYTHT